MTIWKEVLEKIDEYRWRIPKSYKPGMRVDGVIYADEKMITDIGADKAPEQVANVAFLPGIVRYSLAMPDIHWGYGFCLTKDSKISTNFGYYKKISDFEKDWRIQRLVTFDSQAQKMTPTSIARFLKLESKPIYRVTTKTGYEIKATGDHPLLTPSGMKSIKDLAHKAKIAVLPFQGVPYQEPPHETIVSQDDIEKTVVKLGRLPGTPKFDIVIQKLKKRGLLSLSYTHPALPFILKIMGFVFGDGSMNFIGKKGDGVLHFVGKFQDLVEARKDLEKIGYTPGNIYIRRVESYRGKNRYHTTCSFVVNAASLVVLFASLGVPRGTKVTQAYRIPTWIMKAPLWQKRLFLASLFGCELRIPHRRLERRGYFNAPVFPMAKSEELIENGKDFLRDIETILSEFGVKALSIEKRKRRVSKKGTVTWALELIISPKPQNLLNLWSKVGFEYNFDRYFVAAAAVNYIKLKLKILREKEEAIKTLIPCLLRKRLSYAKIAAQLSGNPITSRFVIDICWKLNKGKTVTPRISSTFPLFEDYLKEAADGLGRSGVIWDDIEKIEKLSHKEDVYDFTVSHPEHNFVANNFIVSNCIGGVAATDIDEGGVIAPGGIGFDILCGVRLVKTKLFEEDVKPRLRDLVYALHNDIPAGVGSKGDIRISGADERKLLVEGSKWVVEHGYGRAEDLEHTEERGAIKGAEPDKVSPRAYERGKNQSGTLGSGNHFLEVQAIDEVYDKELADAFGLEKGQVTLMIHSGSRGLGYQVCDDYSRGMIGCLARYKIEVPDRQLACAPVKSEEGKAYLGAMRCAANYAWANRQCLMHLARLVFEKVFRMGPKDLGMDLIYDVAHNIAKIERYNIGGRERTLCVHRKGATRAFGPGHPELPPVYQKTGQPVIIPGDMGRNSYLLVGTKKAEETFFSTCFTGTTKILTSRGLIALKEIYDLFNLNIKFKVASLNINNLSIEWKDIIGVNKRASNTIRVNVSQTGRGRFGALDCTPNHKFGIFNNTSLEFKEVEKIIRDEEMICVLDKIEIPWKLHYPKMAYLAGVFSTNGYIENTKKHLNRRIIFTQKKTLEKMDFIKYVNSSFYTVFNYELKEGKEKYSSGFIRGKLISGSATDFVCSKKGITEEVSRIIEDLPSWVLDLNRESILNFLAGVIDGDGAWNPCHGTINIFNNDDKLTEAVTLGCLKLGILPYISIQRGNCYVIQISELINEILHYTKRVKGIAHKFKYGSKLFSIRQVFNENWKTGNIKWPFKTKADQNCLMAKEKIFETLSSESSAQYDKEGISKLLRSPLRSQRIVRGKFIGKDDVFNIDVEDNHNYFVFTKTFIPVLVENCHGAGRRLSRSAAVRACRGRSISRELEDKGIMVKSTGRETLAEEAPEAYKDVNEVAAVVEGAGISRRVCRMRPLGVIKG